MDEQFTQESGDGFGGGAVRAVPFSNEAEQSVLGAMFLDSAKIPEVLQLVHADDFYIARHQELFRAIVDLYNLGKPVDVVTLKEQLTLRGSLEKIGGLGFVLEVANLVPTTSNVEYYAKIVADKASLRRIIKMAEQMSNACYSGEEEVEKVIGDAEQRLLDIAQGRQSRGLTHIKTYLNESLDKLTMLSENQKEVTGLTTGFVDIDRRTSGLQASDLILIAARPGMGKTSFALNVAQNAALHAKVPVAVFSLEMPGIQLATRMLSSEARVSSVRLRDGNLKEEDWPRIGEAIGKLSEANIYVDDTSNITVTEIGARCRKLKMEHGLGLVVIDYLQLMTGNRRDGSRQQEISDISRSLKILAKDLNVPLIALSQLSRAVESRPDKRPQLSDLRESGAIEQDADMVIFLYRRGAYPELETEEPNKTECIFEKFRNGERGSEYLTWLGEFTKFSNWSEEREQ